MKTKAKTISIEELGREYLKDIREWRALLPDVRFHVTPEDLAKAFVNDFYRMSVRGWYGKHFGPAALARLTFERVTDELCMLPNIKEVLGR